MGSVKPSLRVSIFISFLLVSITPALMLGWYTIKSAQENEYQIVEQKHVLVAENLSMALSRYAEDTRTILEYFAVQDQFEAVEANLSLLEKQHISRVRVMDRSGQQILANFTADGSQSAALTTGQLNALKPYLQTRQTEFLPVQEDYEGRPVILVVTPLNSGKGVLVAEMYLDYFALLQRQIRFGENGYAAMVDQHGNVLAHSRRDWVETSKNISQVSAVKRMMNRETGVEQFYSPAEKANMIAGLTFVDSTGWGIMVAQPVSELENRVSSIRIAVISVVGVGMALAVLVGWFLARRLGRPAQQLAAWQRAALDAADYSIISTDKAGVIATFNKKAEKMLGYRADEVIGIQTPEIIHDVHEVGQYAAELQKELGETIDPGFEVFVRKAREGIIDQREWTYINKDGSRIPVYLSVTALRSDNNEVIGFLGVAIDLTEQKEMQASLAKTETLYQDLFDNAGDAIVILNNTGVVIDCNLAAQQLFGQSEEKFIGQAITTMSPEWQANGESSKERGKKLLLKILREGRQGFEWIHQKTDGTPFYAEVSMNKVEIDGHDYIQGIIRDITERKNLENKLAFQAGHDSLTGLANRITLHDSFDALLEDMQQSDEYMTMMLLDLDRFKDINDTLGHHLGDQVLKQVGPRLQEQCTETRAVIARLGGDEFALLIVSNRAFSELEQMAENIVGALREPFDAGGSNVTVGASLGMAFYPEHGEDSHELLRAADVAMYAAKKSAAGITLYDEVIDHHSTQRLKFAIELKEAIAARQLVLHYQPKIDLSTNEISGFEALVRWQHPEQGLLYPDRFIDLVEMTEIIHPFTKQVVELAIEDKKKLHAMGIQQPVAINLSPRNLVDDAFISWIENELQNHDLNSNSIEIELTESAVMQDTEKAIKLLNQVYEKGVMIAIDDFGTGHSSLSYLRQLPVSSLKIDRSFVMDMCSDEQNLAIVRTTIALAHNLDLRVIAEGVENAESLATLVEMGCDEAQGYGICRPVPLDDLIDWVDQHEKIVSRRMV